MQILYNDMGIEVPSRSQLMHYLVITVKTIINGSWQQMWVGVAVQTELNYLSFVDKGAGHVFLAHSLVHHHSFCP